LIVCGVFGGADVENFPFEVFGEGREAFKGYFEGEGGEERGGVGEDLL
jgi:hypothetical protein